MAALTPLVRAKHYVALATLVFLALVLALFSMWMPHWSVVDTTAGSVHRGLWSTCTNQNSAWDDQICVLINKQNPCDGWFQAARAFSVMGGVAAVLLICVALACSMQAIITKALPFVAVILAFLMMVSMMMAWVSWFVFRGKTCQSWDGQDLGASFIIQVFAWVLALFALIWAVYLFMAKILVAAPDGFNTEKYVADAPAPTYYADAPMAYNSAPIAPTYAAAYPDAQSAPVYF